MPDVADGGWRVAAASAAGTSHVEKGQPCQDATMWTATPEGFLILAVADGATSAQLGHVGAKVAARAAVQHLSGFRSKLPPLAADVAWQHLLTECLTVAREALGREAQSRGTHVDHLASTLILVAATPKGVAAAQIGDGAVVVQDANGDLVALTQPQQGEFLNETTFLISPDAFETLQFAVRSSPASHVAAFSDGLQMLALKMPDQTPHRPFFAPLFDFIARTENPDDAATQLREFIQSPRIAQRTSDDISLILATQARGA